MPDSPILIQIIPASGWCARYFNENFVIENGAVKLDENDMPIFKRLPGFSHESLLALGLFKSDKHTPFVAGVLPDSPSEPLTRELCNNFDCLVYLPEYRDEN